MGLQSITLEAAFWSYVGQTIAFSIGILLVGRPSRSSFLWLLSNCIGVVGVYIIATNIPKGSIPYYGVPLNLLAVSLRALSLSSGSLFSMRNRAGSLAVSLAFVGTTCAIIFVESRYRGAIVILTSMAGIAAAALFLAADRRSKGLTSAWQLQVIHIVLFVAMATQLRVVFPFGDQHLLLGNSNRASWAALGLVLLGTIWQLAFFSMVLGRNARAGMIAARRATRLEERSLLLQTRLGLTQDLANERLNLLRLMSHEVRQPLNNAQAALQTLIGQKPSPRPAGAADSITVATQIQGILDEVILAISNSIIAASIIEWGRNPARVPVGACNTLDLAVMDCSPEDLQRIDVTRCEDDVFLYADPALLRLALRNLLSNALKYSPPGSKVRAVANLDEKRRGITFQITNPVADPASLEGRLFDRGVRGAGSLGEGSGLGLFMVSETAQLHHGTVACWQLPPNHVTFELFIPA